MKLISKKELAERYSVHPCTVSKWVRARILPVIKVNPRCLRFDVDKCDQALNRRSLGFVLPGLLVLLIILISLVGTATEWQQFHSERKWNGLENRRGRKTTVGSNPTPSALF